MAKRSEQDQELIAEVDETDLRSAFFGTLRSELDEAPELTGAFADAYARFEVLRERYVTRQIEGPEFGRSLQRLRVVDADGRRWTIGATTGNWYCRVLEGTPWTPMPAPSGDGRFEHDDFAPQVSVRTETNAPQLAGVNDGQVVVPQGEVAPIDAFEEQQAKRRKSKPVIGGGPRVAGQQLIDLIDRAVNIEDGTTYDPLQVIVDDEVVGGVLTAEELPTEEPFWHQPIIDEAAQNAARRRQGRVEVVEMTEKVE